jgi:hypothetical protein
MLTLHTDFVRYHCELRGTRMDRYRIFIRARKVAGLRHSDAPLRHAARNSQLCAVAGIGVGILHHRTNGNATRRAEDKFFFLIAFRLHCSDDVSRL